MRCGIPRRTCAARIAGTDAEHSVRERLYGRLGALEVRPIPPPAAGVGRLLGGRYRVGEYVGAGGMATIHRAWDELLDRGVAVKLLAERLACEPAYAARLRREAELGASLDHPNVVTVLDAGSRPREFLVMEFVEGVDAAALLRRRGPLPAAEAVDLVVQIAGALEHAHERGVVHGDVSPRNILLGAAGGTAKLCDFGLASGSGDTADRDELNGTPGYVAPEVAAGAVPTPRSDLFALGAVAHELLVGRPVDPVPTVAWPSRVGLPSGLPDGMTEVVGRAVSTDPEGRQDSVAEFAAELQDGLGAAASRQRAALRLEPAVRRVP